MRKNSWSLRFVVIPIIIIALCCGAAISLAIAWRNGLPDNGFADIRHIDDVAELGVCLEYAYGDDILEHFSNGEDYFINEQGRADIIIVARPTGGIVQTRSSIGQEVSVVTVIKGEELVDSSRKYYVYDSLGFGMVDGKPLYRNARGLMAPGSEYLLFLQDNPFSSLQEPPGFPLFGFFSSINLSMPSTPTFFGDYKSMDIFTITGYDFFSVSQEATKLANNIKKAITKEFIP